MAIKRSGGTIIPRLFNPVNLDGIVSCHNISQTLKIGPEVKAHIKSTTMRYSIIQVQEIRTLINIISKRAHNF